MITWTNQSKNSSSFGNTAQSSPSSYLNQPQSLFQEFLLLETGDHLLLETGDRIILEQSVPSGGTYTNQLISP